MTEIERQEKKMLLQAEIIDTIAYCMGDCKDEDFKFAFECVKQLMETELSRWDKE